MKAQEKYSDRSNLWSRRYEVASDNQEPRFKKIASWYDLMYAAINTKDYAPWRSKVFIPILASKQWSMIAKFIGLKPGFEVSLRDPEIEDDRIREVAEKAEQKLEYDYDNPCFEEPMRDKLFAPLMDAGVGGLGIAKTPWVKKTQTSYKRPVDETTGIDLSKEVVTDTETGYNDLIPVNIFNFFYAPNARSIQGAQWLMIREFKTLDDLKGLNDANGGKLYKNLESIKDMRASADKWAQYNRARDRIQNSADPIADDDTLDQVEIFECYDKQKGTIETYAVGKNAGKTQWVCIRNQQNPYWHRKYPIVPFYVRRRPYQLWGQGLFEDTERLQSAVNDVFNHYLDNWSLAADGMLFIEENSDVDDYVVQPGGHVTYRGTKPEQFKFPDPNPAAFNQVFSTIEGAIEAATISPYAQGTPNAATDKTAGTASGIARLQEAAGDLIGFMRANFQTSVRTVGQMWLSNNQQFMAKPLTVMANVDGKKQPTTISPEDLQYEMDLRVDDASMEPPSKQDKLQKAIAYQDRSLALQQASFTQAQTIGTPPLAFNFAAMFDEMSQDFDKKNSEKFILPPDQIPPPPQAPEAPVDPNAGVEHAKLALQAQQQEHQQKLDMMNTPQGQEQAMADQQVQQDAAHMAGAGLL